MTPSAVLALGRDLLARADGGLGGERYRAAAILGRQALERAVAEALEHRAPGASRASARAQLLALPTYAPTEPSLAARYLWSALTRACHHHPYELAPTAGEVAGWLEETERVIAALAPAAS
jgi:cytochrome c5